MLKNILELKKDNIEKENIISKNIMWSLGLLWLIYIIVIKLWYIDINLSNNMINGYTIYNNLLKLNIINSIIMTIVIFVSLISVIFYIKRLTGIYKLDIKIQREKIMILLIILNMIGIIILVSINDIMLLYILIEYQSFLIYIISCIYKESSGTVISSLYYFIIGSIGSLIILDGTVNLYESINIMNMDYIILLVENLSSWNNINSSWLIIIMGLLWKMGVGPLYNYLLIIYTYVPTIITYYISLIPKISILYLILIIINIINMVDILNISNINNNLYIILGISMLIGSLGGLNEINIKKILGYSSLLNISYILVNIVSNNNLSNRSYIFYIIQYTITHINIFSILLILPIYMCYNYIKTSKNNIELNKKSYNILLNKYSPIEYVNQLSDLYIKNKYLFICLSISLFSLIGIPPLIGFYGKYLILISLLNSGVVYLSLLLIIVSTISTVYYLSIIKVMTFNIKKSWKINIIFNNLLNYNNKENKYNYNNNVITLLISILTIIIIFVNILWKKIIRGTNYLVTLWIYNNGA